MASAYRSAPPLLPLLLWETPPGLERILAQEGIPFVRLVDPRPLAFSRGRFVLFDGRKLDAAWVRASLSSGHWPIDVDTLRDGEAKDPFRALVDNSAARATWRIGEHAASERVSRTPKAQVRRRLIAKLRAEVLRGGGLWARLSAFPHPYRSAFNFRADLDEPCPADYFKFARARKPLDDCSTHFVSTRAYGRFPAVLSDLTGRDAQSHGHHHVVYRDPEANRRNIERAHGALVRAGITPVGFAAPEGRWNEGVDEILEGLGYEYASDFAVGYDDLPFYPHRGGRFSRVLQVPIHPICEGLLLNAGARDGSAVAEHLSAVIRDRAAAGEPAFVYGHPEGRLAKFPEILASIAETVAGIDLLWRTTLTEFARWWRWRGGRTWTLIAKGDRRFEVQLDDWDTSYPLALEIVRGEHVAAIPLTSPRQVIGLEGLAYERRQTRADLPQPIPGPRRSLRLAVREALHYETVTPIEELADSTLGDRLRKGIRLWRGPGKERSGMTEAPLDRSSLASFDAASPMAPGSVLFHAPSHAFQAPGGGEIQLLNTARHLEALGVPVRPFVPWTDRLERARLVHLFGMSREGLELARVARSRGVPVVLSPICWFEPGALAALARNRRTAIADVAKWALRVVLPGLPGWRAELLAIADRILPNSASEARQLVRLFGVDRRKLRVVPNGVDSRFAEGDPTSFREGFGDDPFVLYVGRVEPRKNVLGLVRASIGLGRSLVILGDVVPGFEAYGEAVRREGRGFLRWLPRFPHDSPMLASAYAAARVFALPSWFETPGLAALEAAMAGCSVVITPFGSTREYFGRSARYARPDRPREIREAIEGAWESGPEPGLSRLIAARFGWSEVAGRTARAYDEVAA